MKEAAIAGLAGILLCLAVPVAVTKTARQPIVETEIPAATVLQVSAETCSSLPPEESFDESFMLPILADGVVQTMSLRTYLIGAVLGEMPTSFEPQALQAQAVACRTYVLRRYSHRKHDAAAVCTSSSCCLQWEKVEDYTKQEVDKAMGAVIDTDGEVILYDESLIDATFFSCSGGITEAAEAVWGSDLPYLQSVDSPGEENAVHFSDTVEVDKDTFCESLLSLDEKANFSEDASQWIGESSYTQGEGIKTICIGGQLFSGKQIRKLFHLSSTSFTVNVRDTVVFTTKGYGHRVGLSQYGANAMAQRGSCCEEILKWYYTGTEIKKLSRFSPEQP